MKTRFVLVLPAVLFLCLLPGAFAQGNPTPAPSPTPVALPTMPPTVSPVLQSVINAVIGRVKQDYGWDPNHVRGDVTFFRRFEMQVRFANGQYRVVHLHQGTVINPRGATITTGQHVDVIGQGNTDGSLNANQITIQ